MNEHEHIRAAKMATPFSSKKLASASAYAIAIAIERSAREAKMALVGGNMIAACATLDATTHKIAELVANDERVSIPGDINIKIVS